MTEGETERARPIVVEATYDGTCSACGEEINEGDPIVRDAYDEAWIHEDCYDG